MADNMRLRRVEGQAFDRGVMAGCAAVLQFACAPPGLLREDSIMICRAVVVAALLFVPQPAHSQTIPLLALVTGNASPPVDDRSFYEGVPIRTTYPNVITVLDNGAYVVGYDEVRRNPAWSAYRLFPNPGTFDFDRPSGFRIDTRTTARVAHSHYTNSGFSRGHMAPNFAIMTRYG